MRLLALAFHRLPARAAPFRRKHRATATLIASAAAALLPLALPAQLPMRSDYPQLTSKAQPLPWQALPPWLTLDWQLRTRLEGQTSYDQLSGNDRTYVLTRLRGAVELRPTHFLTGFLQFQDTHALGLPAPSVASNMRDTFDLFQGYLDLHTRSLHLITGRQKLQYGSERLVGISDWTNNSRSWDGFRARLGNSNLLDLFSTSVVSVHPTSLDKHGAGLTFHGAVATLTTLVPGSQLQPFVYIRALRSVTSQQGIRGSELETTFGAELNGDILGGLKYDVLGALQRGSFSNNSIRAGAGYAQLGYKFKKLPWQPSPGLEYDFASGNQHKDPNQVSTFDQLSPSNHNAFGLVDLFGFQNITEKRLNLNLAPRQDLTLLLQTETLHLASLRDNVYASAASTLIKAPAAGFDHDDIGQGLDVSGAYTFRKHLLVQMGVGHLFPGRVLTENGKAPPLTIGYLQLTYRFHLNHDATGPTPGNF